LIVAAIDCLTLGLNSFFIMVHFHPIKVAQVKRETSDSVAISLDIPNEHSKDFLYAPGQYLTFRTHINGEEVRRSYSICSVPSDGRIQVGIKQVEGGLFSTWANKKLKAGDTLEAMPPLGKFVWREIPENQQVLFIAAGSGITPILSLIKQILESDSDRQVILIYGNRSVKTIMFREAIEALKNKHLDRFQIFHVLSKEKLNSPLMCGRINEDKCNTFFTSILPLNNVGAAYLCGPYEMIQAAKQAMLTNGLAEKDIHFELFTTGNVLPNLAPKTQEAAFDPTTSAKVSLKLDGKTFEFPLRYGGDNILDAALSQGADLPYACKGGVCCTCRAKLVKGEVDMDVNFGLEPDEIAAGFILTCQSHPRTPEIEVDFDIK